MGNFQVNRYCDTQLKKLSDFECVSENLLKINLYTPSIKRVVILKHKTTNIDDGKQISEWEMFDNEKKIGHVIYECLDGTLEKVKTLFCRHEGDCAYRFNGYMGRFYKNEKFILYSILDSSVKWPDIVEVMLTNECM